MTDGLALVPMLFPPAAELACGFQQPGEAYFFAMGYSASLMAGWTLLLIWAYARPIERRFVAVLTLFVIAGLAATEAVAVIRGAMHVGQVVRTWALQIALGYLFASGYRVSRNSAGGRKTDCLG